MADFAEHFYASQLDSFTYRWCWYKIDLAYGEEVDFDYNSSCSDDDLCIALEEYGFDAEKVFKHFEDYPCSHIVLKDEY